GVQQLMVEGYRGSSVTVPNEQAIMRVCSDVDDTGRAIGAVNTVIVDSGDKFGRIAGVIGFIENIRQSAPAYDFSKAPAYVIGAGGAARAVMYGLLQAGVPEIHLTNRSKDKALELQKMAPDQIRVIDWEQRNMIDASYGIVVN